MITDSVIMTVEKEQKNNYTFIYYIRICALLVQYFCFISI